MVTAILFLVLGVGFLIYNRFVAAPGTGFTLIGTEIDFGWVLIALGVFNLVRYWKYRRPRLRKKRPEEP
jgi:hypothetical protein